MKRVDITFQASRTKVTSTMCLIYLNNFLCRFYISILGVKARAVSEEN